MKTRWPGPVATFATTTTVGYGVLLYSYGVLLVPMEQSLGWSRSFFTGAFSLASVIGAVLTMAVGQWLDRHPARLLLLPGAVVATLSVAAWSTARSQLAFVCIWAVLGACQAILFYEPAFTMLTKWFDGAERHRAITAVTLLAGLASTIFGPLTSTLERALGWRSAVLVLAVLVGVVTVPGFALGLRPPRGTGSDDEASHRSEASVVPKDAFRDPRLWLITVAYLLSMFTAVAVVVLLVAFLRERGVPAAGAAFALGAIGLVQVAGRSTFARLSARTPAMRLGTWVMVAKAAGLTILLAVPGWAGIVTFVVVYGAANGISTLTRATSLAELFGPEHYGAIAGVVSSIGAIGGAVAPFVAAVAIDVVGDELPVWTGFVVVNLLAALTNARAARDAVRVGPVVDIADADPIELEP